jgi:bacteriocin-like protein
MRTLRLERETLTELTVEELAEIVGGRALPSIPIRACVSDPQHCVTTV